MKREYKLEFDRVKSFVFLWISEIFQRSNILAFLNEDQLNTPSDFHIQRALHIHNVTRNILDNGIDFKHVEMKNLFAATTETILMNSFFFNLKKMMNRL